MKAFFVFLGLSALFLSQAAFAQCDNSALQSMANQELKPYQFETMAFVPFKKGEEHPDLMQTTFTVFKGEKYKVLIKAMDFYQDPQFSLYYGEGDAREIIFMNNEDPRIKEYEFTADKAGIVSIEFTFPAGLTEADFNANRCIAFMVGYMTE